MMSRPSSRFLLLVSRPAMLEEARVLYETLEQRWPNCATVVISGELADESIRTADLRGVNIVIDAPKLAVLSRSQFWFRLLRYGALRTLWTSIAIIRRRLHVAKLLMLIKPDALIVFEDRAIDPEMIWLKMAEHRKLPSIMVRYASSSVESDVWTRYQKRPYSLDHGHFAWARRLFARRYPSHALDIGMGRQIFFSLWDSLALIICGMIKTRPWIAGGGAVNSVAVQGKIDFDEAMHYTNMPSRFHITGQPSWDKMAIRNGFLQRKHVETTQIYSTKISRPCTLVCALPQWGEHLQMPWNQHLERVEQLFAILQRIKCKTILSLHPKAQSSDYRSLAARYGLQIADQPLSEILPQADIFVASWSSTLRWAAMLGIASINLDWADQKYSLFAELPSLLSSTAPSDLESILGEITQQDETRIRLGKCLLDESAAFGIMDGLAGQRIISLAECLIKEDNHG